MENLKTGVREHPFEYTGRVGREYFWDRDPERLALRELYGSGRIGILSGPRRVGKSSLAEIVASDMRRAGLIRAAFLDVRETTAATFFNRLTERVTSLYAERWSQRLLRQLSEELRRFRHSPEFSFDPHRLTPTLRFTRIPKDEEDVVLNDIFTLLERAPAEIGKSVVLVLDEFQDVLSRSQLLPEVIKSRFRGGEGVSLLLTGSRQHLMDELTSAPSAPLYRIGSMLSLGPLPRQGVAAEIRKRFGWHRITLASEAIDAIYDLCEGIPKNIQWLCATLFDLARRHGWSQIVAAHVEIGVEDLYSHALSEEFGRPWALLTEPQRELAAAIAVHGGNHIMSRDFFELVNPIRRPAAATVQRSIAALVEKEIVDPTAAGYVFKDPFFRLYLSRMQSS